MPNSGGESLRRPISSFSTLFCCGERPPPPYCLGHIGAVYPRSAITCSQSFRPSLSSAASSSPATSIIIGGAAAHHDGCVLLEPAADFCAESFEFAHRIGLVVGDTESLRRIRRGRVSCAGSRRDEPWGRVRFSDSRRTGGPVVALVASSLCAAPARAEQHGPWCSIPRRTARPTSALASGFLIAQFGTPRTDRVLCLRDPVRSTCTSPLRSARTYHPEIYARMSDIGILSMLLVSVAASPIATGKLDLFAEDLTILSEAVFAMGILNTAVKRLSARPRPAVKLRSPTVDIDAEERYVSFFSGHTSLAATLAGSVTALAFYAGTGTGTWPSVSASGSRSPSACCAWLPSATGSRTCSPVGSWARRSACSSRSCSTRAKTVPSRGGPRRGPRRGRCAAGSAADVRVLRCEICAAFACGSARLVAFCVRLVIGVPAPDAHPYAPGRGGGTLRKQGGRCEW